MNMNIRGKFVAILLAFGLLPSIAIFLVYQFEEQIFKDSFGVRIQVSAASLNDVIDRNLFERYGDVQAFGLNGEASNPDNWGKPSADNPLVRSMNSYMTGYNLKRVINIIGIAPLMAAMKAA